MKNNSTNKNNIILPDVEAFTVIDLVRTNIQKVDAIDPESVIEITGGQLSKQNNYSNRSGAVVSIMYRRNGLATTKEIWVKRLGEPDVAFDSINKIYKMLLKNAYEKPVPEPYFYDKQNRLLFTDKISGGNLKELVLSYALLWNRHPDPNLPGVFFDIGLWLSRYNETTYLGKAKTLADDVIANKKALVASNHFSAREKESIIRTLDVFEVDPVINRQFPLVRPHNDFTLRNLFQLENNSFCVVDWDAMIHPQFPQEAMGWWDLSSLYLNIQSMLRLSPLCSKRRLRTLSDELLKGYFLGSGDSEEVTIDIFRRTILYVITLQYYLGLNADRPMYNIYNKNFGSRFIRKLRKGLVSGNADLLG